MKLTRQQSHLLHALAGMDIFRPLIDGKLHADSRAETLELIRLGQEGLVEPDTISLDQMAAQGLAELLWSITPAGLQALNHHIGSRANV